jgi:hypothetical protein
MVLVLWSETAFDDFVLALEQIHGSMEQILYRIGFEWRPLQSLAFVLELTVSVKPEVFQFRYGVHSLVLNQYFLSPDLGNI